MIVHLKATRWGIRLFLAVVTCERLELKKETQQPRNIHSEGIRTGGERWMAALLSEMLLCLLLSMIVVFLIVI